MKRKTKEYTGDDPDRLGAFKAAAALQHTTPQRALAGMLAKHLLGKANAATTNFNTLSVQIKDLESRMNANAELQKQIVNYAKTRAVYVEYRKAGYSKKFRTEHEAEILLHKAAKNHFDELGIKKLPSVKSLREEYTALLEQNGKPILPISRLHNVRANVEYLLEISSPPQPQHRKIPSIRFVCFWPLAFQRNAQPLPPAMISGVWGYVTNKHLAGIPGTGFLLNTQSYVRLHCLPVSVFRIS